MGVSVSAFIPVANPTDPDCPDGCGWMSVHYCGHTAFWFCELYGESLTRGKDTIQRCTQCRAAAPAVRAK